MKPHIQAILGLSPKEGKGAMNSESKIADEGDQEAAEMAAAADLHKALHSHDIRGVMHAMRHHHTIMQAKHEQSDEGLET